MVLRVRRASISDVYFEQQEESVWMDCILRVKLWMN